MNENKLRYYCSNCSTILRKTDQELEVVIREPCPECGSMLSQDQLQVSVRRTTKLVSVFRKASLFPKLIFDIEKIDSILHFMRLGQIIGISGYDSQQLVERLCVRSTLPERYGGLDSDVVIVDGNNRSDPYLCISFARQYGLKVGTVLSRIISSRAFTIHQLASLVITELPEIVKKHEAKLVVISDILGMFIDDPYLDPKESEIIAKEIADSISKLKGSIVMVSMTKPSPYDNIIAKTLDKLIRLSKQRERICIEVDNKQAVIRESELLTVPDR